MSILIGRWGILWRKLEVPLCRVKSIVKCCMVLHNLCINDGDKKHAAPEIPAGAVNVPSIMADCAQQQDQYVVEGQCTYRVDSQGDVERESEDMIRDHHAPLVCDNKRTQICATIKKYGLKRPEYSTSPYK